MKKVLTDKNGDKTYVYKKEINPSDSSGEERWYLYDTEKRDDGKVIPTTSYRMSKIKVNVLPFESMNDSNGNRGENTSSNLNENKRSKSENRLLEVMSRLDKSFKPKLNEEMSAYNDAGEPNFSHNDYQRYSAPSEDGDNYDDSRGEPEPDDDLMSMMVDELKRRGVYMHTIDGDTYTVDGKNYSDSFEVYDNNDKIVITYYNGEGQENLVDKTFDDLDQAINFIMQNKIKLKPYMQAMNDNDEAMSKYYRDEAMINKYGGY